MIKILVITPVKHINGVCERLEKYFDVTYIDDPTYDEVYEIVEKYNVIFTNPNKSKVYIDSKLMKKAKELTAICTASTGTNHIELNYADKNNITVISLGKDIDIIEKISSTAELALALTMAALRNIVSSSNSVRSGKWDYLPYIGRQVNYLNVGVIGYGRLGRKYAKYMSSLGAKIFVYDPHIKKISTEINRVSNLNELLVNSDIVSIHVHVNDETINMINSESLKFVKKNLLLINTSRGEIVNEADLLEFIKKNNEFKYATDVITNEVKAKKSVILQEFINNKNNNQIIITPHIGGMTTEAQEIAYNHAVNKLAANYGLI